MTYTASGGALNSTHSHSRTKYSRLHTYRDFKKHVAVTN